MHNKKRLDTYKAQWHAMRPKQHLDQASAIVAAVLQRGAKPTIRTASLAHAQTHLLAGVLKSEIARHST